MKLSRKILILILVLVLIIVPLTPFNLKTMTASSNIDTRKPVRVGVLLYNFEDVYFSLLRKNLESIQKENENEVEFVFFDGKTNAATQHQIIDNMISDSFDLLLLNIVEPRESVVEDIINKVRIKNIPVVFFISTIPNLDIIKSYPKAAYIFSDYKELPILEGQIIVDALPEVQELIKKGYMLGSVFHDPRTEAEAIYNIGMNLVAGKNITEGTNYTIDPLGVMIPADFKIYTIETIPQLPQ